MLLRFKVSNFLSFSDEVDFNMFPANFKIHKPHVYHTEGGVDVLKAAAIYGANGSGKSNFVKAVDFFYNAVKSSSLTHFENVYFKLGDDTYKNKPTSFEIELYCQNRYFIYGFSFIDYWVKEEWLIETLPSKNEQILLFSREKLTKDAKNKITLHEKYIRTEKEKLRFEIYSEELMPSEIFLWRIKDRFEEAKLVFNWIIERIFVIHPHSEYALNFGLAENEELKNYFNDFLRYSNTGMSKIDLIAFNLNEIKSDFLLDDIKKRLNKGEKLVEFTYDGKNFIAIKDNGSIRLKKLAILNQGKNNKLFEFNLDEQSDGSKRILDLIPILFNLEKKDCLIFIDEIDRSLHPKMVKEFLTFIMSRKTKGQLIFTTHESHLLDLDIFRQDEIWFTEKDEEGSTKMYPLSDFKPRYDLDIQKGYLAGRFGAIPFLGNLKDLIPAYETE